jgi:Kef-type K+ transport system membrane component KefB
LENSIIFEIAAILLAGLIFGRLGKFAKLPNVTGYLIAGLILGPCVLNVIPISMVDGFSVISDIALSFIAFSIGSQFSFTYFKQVGMAPIIIAITESFGAIILVTGVLIAFGIDLKLSIMLGAIAAATAPAQTIMVVNQYNAKGPLTSMLLSVAAIDDAVALVGFGIAAAVVNMLSAAAPVSVLSFLSPLYQIGVSLALGIAAGLLMKLLFMWFKKPSNRICIITALIALTYWLAGLVGGSTLLACMALGAMLVNTTDEAESAVKLANAFTPPIFVIFFVISGAGFDIGALSAIGIIGLIYVVARVGGKMLGAWFGGVVTHQEKKICRYLGPTLMPQAGVALGLIVLASTLVPDYAPQLRTVILCSTFIYSIVGPSAAKWALQKGGEIAVEKKPKGRKQEHVSI